jgi:flagellar biosynthesis/type III secretory pathway protein FliH
MEDALKAYYETDPGFAQFVERHGYVASLPQVRKEYKLWQIEQVVTGEENARIFARGRDEGKAEGIAVGKAEGKAEGIAVGKAEGKAEGIAERDMEIALNAIRKARSGETGVIETLKDFGVSDETIRAAQKQASDERTQAYAEKRRSDPGR